MSDAFFTNMNSESLSELISAANSSILYAAPGIHSKPARALIEASTRLGADLVMVFLDVNENVFRMGYGQVEAIRAMQAAGIVVRNIRGLRNGLVVVDGEGFSYTPTALLLEKDSGRDEVLNAMRLTPAQAAEAMSRLSPASKALALVQATNESQKAAIQAFETETTPTNVTAESVSNIEKRLKDAPPVQFELERQVRVFQPFFQYVELSLSGAAIQRHKIRIPEQLLGSDTSKETKRRLKTTFDLIDKNASVSSKELDDELKKIREDYTRSLGGKKGRIILKKALPRFKERLEELQKKIESHQQVIIQELNETLEKSKQLIVEHYLPTFRKDPPEFVYGLFGDPSREQLEDILANEIDKVMPDPRLLASKIVLEVNYKDVTFDTLNQSDFLECIKNAYPQLDWDKPYHDFQAASESNNRQ